jgi:hypothetical protein
MEAVFIAPTTEGSDMQTKTIERKLTANDRCDGCGAQAYVHVQGVAGELMFCGHHFSKIMGSISGKRAMEKFAFNISDERENLNK